MMDLVQTDPRKVSWRSLVRKSEFQKMYEQGVKMVGRLVVVYLMVPDSRSDLRTDSPQATPPPDLARAVVASRKVGNAVARNRAKRLLREAHRLGVLGQPGQARQIRDRFLREPDGRPDSAASANEAQAAAEPVTTPEAAAAAHPETNIFTGLWVVLVARQRILDASSREVREELDGLLAGPPPPVPGNRPPTS